MIIHSDTDEDDEQQTVKPEIGAPSSHHHGPMTRTRKARDAQLRLGVGRPTAVGGQGARTVTRSASVGKGTRPRSGRGAKPAQVPIVEGSSERSRFPFHLLSSDILTAFLQVSAHTLHPRRDIA